MTRLQAIKHFRKYKCIEVWIAGNERISTYDNNDNFVESFDHLFVCSFELYTSKRTGKKRLVISFDSTKVGGIYYVQRDVKYSQLLSFIRYHFKRSK